MTSGEKKRKTKKRPNPTLQFFSPRFFFVFPLSLGLYTQLTTTTATLLPFLCLHQEGMCKKREKIIALDTTAPAIKSISCDKKYQRPTVSTIIIWIPFQFGQYATHTHKQKKTQSPKSKSKHLTRGCQHLWSESKYHLHDFVRRQHHSRRRCDVTYAG